MFIISGMIIRELKFIDGKSPLCLMEHRRNDDLLNSWEKMAFIAPKKLPKKPTHTNKQKKSRTAT